VVPTFRRAVPGEAEQLTEITIASKAHWGYDQSFMARARPELTVTRDYLETNDCWVAERDGRIAGWFSLVATDESLLLDNFFLLPAYIGAGLGRHMWQQALNRAVEMGAERLTLESDPNASGFYARMGARRTGSSPVRSTGRALPLFEIDLPRSHELDHDKKAG
jgi:N-acetylglutamate synthase-like GNAT family acetyltransferase